MAWSVGVPVGIDRLWEVAGNEYGICENGKGPQV